MQAQLKQQADLDKIEAIKTTAKNDTASMMARFGSLAALAQAAKG